MKFRFYSKTVIAVAVAVAAAAAKVSQAQEQPIPPPTAALPTDIAPGSPTAQVVKLIQAGVDAGVVKNYVANYGCNFNLDAGQIISLTDAGVPTEVINAIMAHDKSVVAPPPAAPQPSSAVATAPVEISAPAVEVSANTFNDTLTPYGSWVMIEGYGRCWRPTTVIYDSTWRPYCDRGHWVYSDCGWYWDSDYAWGITFHYGRWFHDPRWGWCWWPDTVWAPSWVTWRSCDDYCGWAPLPPFSIYRPGVGFFYRNTAVEIGFGFGLEADCFIFVSPSHFCDRRPRSFCVESARVPEIYHRSAIINNYNAHDRVVFNGGIAVERIRSAGHRDIQPVALSAIPNASRQGWRGNNTGDHRVNGLSPENSRRELSPANTENHHGPVFRNEPANDSRTVHPQERNPQASVPVPHANQVPMTPARPVSRDETSRVLAPEATHPSPTGSPANGTLHNSPAGNDRIQTVHSQPVTIPAHTQPVPVASTPSTPANVRPVSPVWGNHETPRNYSSETTARVNPPAAAPVYNTPHYNPPVAPVNNAPRSSPPPAAVPSYNTPHYNLPASPAAPAYNTPHNSPAPAQPPSQPRSNSDKDKQNH